MSQPGAPTPSPAGPDVASPSVLARRAADERSIGRLLVAITYVAVAFLLVGVVAMIAAGISPLAAPPSVDLTGIVSAALAIEPVGLLWLGLIVVIATPIVRVIAAAVAYARGGETRMLGISIAILAVIAIGIATTLVTEVAA